MKKRFLIIFLACLVILTGIKIYSSLHSGTDANSLKKIDGISIWRAKDRNDKRHYIVEYCRFDEKNAIGVNILRCKVF